MGMVVMKPGLVTPEKKKNLAWLGRDVAAMQSAVEQCNLNHVPETIRKVLESGAWREFWMHTLYRFSSFREFITTSKRDGGCGWEPKYVEALLKKSGDVDTLAAYRRAMKAQGKRTDLHDNIMEVKAEYGTSLSYTLDRLSKSEEHADLYDKVKTGEMTANAAAKEAGWRKPPSPLKQLRKAWAKATPDERAEFLIEISAEIPERPQRGAA